MSEQGQAGVNWPLLARALALLALAAVSFAMVRPTNFRGNDEWVILALLSQGILDFPHANRPASLVWALPAWLIAPDRLWGFLVVHVVWIGLGGVVAFLVARLLLPAPCAFAYLTGVFTVLWAPTDDTRLSSVHMVVYSGCTFGVLLTLWLFMEAWSRRFLVLAVAAAAAGLVAVLTLEVVLAPLALVPLFLLLLGGAREPRRLAVWTSAFYALCLVAGLRAAAPLWSDPGRVAYQAEFQAPDLSPSRLIEEALHQLWFHLGPLVDVPTGQALPVTAVAVAIFSVGFLSTRLCAEQRRALTGKEEPTRRALLVAAAIGLLWALASYLPFVLSPKTIGPVRTQFLSTPGVAVLLAAAVVWLSSFLPRRGALPVTYLLGVWVVTLGISRIAIMQAEWDGKRAYTRQRTQLLTLAAIAPDFTPGTLVVLLGNRNTWNFDFSFRHAVSYLYERRAIGHAVGSNDLLYKTYYAAGGVRSEPASVLRGPWREPTMLYPYEAVVVLRENKGGRLELLEAWPERGLPTLPPGANYAPRTRLRSGPSPPRLAILEHRR